MSRASSTDAPKTPNPPPPAYEGHLRSGRARSLPITAGDQGDPTGGTTTPPPGVRVDDGFLMASSAIGPRTTPLDRAMVVEGTPIQQENRFQSVRTPSRMMRTTPLLFYRSRSRPWPRPQLPHSIPMLGRLVRTRLVHIWPTTASATTIMMQIWHLLVVASPDLSRFFPRYARVSVLFGRNLPLLWCLI